MEPAALLVGLMVASMVVTLLLAWRWFNSFRLAFITMLIVGKLWAGILWAFGYDRELFRIYLKNRLSGEAINVSVTATEVVFLTFFATLVLTLSWHHIEKELGVKLPW